jgi:3-oxoacyl-[acyl-carrier-protein] synthase-1
MAAEGVSLVVTGIGARAAVGDHAVQVAASVRAGVNGFRIWPESGAVGFAAAFTDPVLHDAPWTEKALRLLEDPVREALWSAGLLDTPRLAAILAGGRACGYLGIPHPTREGTRPGALEATLEQLSYLLVRGATAPLPLASFGLDQPAGALALARAGEALRAGRIDLALVCGVDSLLHEAALFPMIRAGRVKTERNRSGFVPGEAGVALVVETAGHAGRRRAPVLARLDVVALDAEQRPAGPEAAVRVDALLRTLAQAAGAGAAPRVFTHVVSDLDGERWRFLEWALAETRSPALFAEGWEHWSPADTLGEVGAAFVPLAVALLARGFARGYAGGGPALVVASSERGERAAIALSRPEGRGP